jgi:hypothetical protein
MITTKLLEDKLEAHLRIHSGLDAHRSYLGMSDVAKCARQAYDRFVDGAELNDYHHRMSYVGYLFEQDILRNMREIRVATLDRRELVAGFDDRLRGHIDGVTAWGDLLKIKSLTLSKFSLICQQARALHEHNDQVQLYMRYGGWRYAWIVYVCRETYERKVFRVRYDEARAAALEVKAMLILAAIDRRERPKCECGYCKKSNADA